jgi:hypothetical protein
MAEIAIIFHLVVLASRHFSFRLGRSLTKGGSRHYRRVIGLVKRETLGFSAIAKTILICPLKHFLFSSQA